MANHRAVSRKAERRRQRTQSKVAALRSADKGPHWQRDRTRRDARAADEHDEIAAREQEKDNG